jgi:hypothetical protein
MANKQLQLRRGTKTQNASFKGAKGEVSAIINDSDRDTETLVLGNDSTTGGTQMLRADLKNLGNNALAEDATVSFKDSSDEVSVRIIDVADPTDDQDVATKKYVDSAGASQISIGELGDVTTSAQADAHVLIYNNAASEFQNKAMTGDVTITAAGVSAIGASKVLTAMIADDNVTTVKVLDSNITTAKIADNAVTNAKLADNAVDTAELAASSVETVKIDNGAVTTLKVADDAITNAKLADDAVDSDQIADGAVDNIHLAGSIANAKLSNSSITVKSGTDETAIALGGTITYIGTANEVEVSESNGTVTFGLPNNVTIAGNLTVSGTTTTVESATLNVEDPIIMLGSGNTANSVDLGFVSKFNDGAAKYAGLVRDATDSKFRFFETTEDLSSATAIDIADGGYSAAKIVVDEIEGTVKTVSHPDVTTLAALATVGTVTSGTWNATPVATAYIADSAITTAKVTDLNVTTGKLAANAVTGAKIADDAVDSEHIVDGSIDTAHIADVQVTAAKLAADSVTTVKILDANVTTDKINDDAITTAKVLDANITAAKLAADSVISVKIADNAVLAAAINASAVTTAKIADSNVTLAKMATASVDTSQLVDSAVATGKIADGAVLTAKIADANVTTAKLANTSVTTGKLALDAVTGAQIADDAIDSEHYAAGSIDAAHLASDSVITAKILDANITTVKLADSAITTVKLGADSVTGAKIADDAIDSEHYVDGSIDTAHLADDLITADKIADGVVNSEHLAAGAIDTNHIADSQVTTAKIPDNAITTAKIADNAVTTAKIDADAVTGAEIADNAIDSEHYVDGSIDTVHIANSQVTAAKLASDAVTTVKILDDNVTFAKIELIDDAVVAGDAKILIGDETDFSEFALSGDATMSNTGVVTLADNSVDTVQLEDDAVTTAKVTDANITAAKLAANSVETAKITDLNVTTGKLANAAVTTVKITDANVTTAKLADANVTTVKINDDAVTNAKIASDAVTASEISFIADDLETTDTHMLVCNGSSQFDNVAMSGDATLANSGALTLANTQTSIYTIQRGGTGDLALSADNGNVTVEGVTFNGTAVSGLASLGFTGTSASIATELGSGDTITIGGASSTVAVKALNCANDVTLASGADLTLGGGDLELGDGGDLTLGDGNIAVTQGNLTLSSGDVVINGKLTVNGSANNIKVADSLLELNSAATALSGTRDLGLFGHTASDAWAGLVLDGTDTKWKFFSATVDPSSNQFVTPAAYADVVANNIEVVNITSSGCVTKAVSTVTSNDTTTVLGSSHHILFISGSNSQLTVPTAVGITGREYVISNIDSSNNITINQTGSQLSTTSVSGGSITAGQKVTIVSDGSVWRQI